MSKWEFRAVKVLENGRVELGEISARQMARMPDYEIALDAAHASEVPDPPFSNYHVRGSVLAGGKILPAGNIEYGLCQALHCEETAVAAIRVAHNGKIGRAPVIGFVSNKDELAGAPTCCGNCRDILLDAFGPELEFVSGAKNGVALVSSLSDLLKENFRPATFGFLEHGLAKEALWIGWSLMDDAYSPAGLHPERKYFACIQCENLHFGAHDIMCDYHPIYAVRDAVRQARRQKDFKLKRVFISRNGSVSDIRSPHVMYKDRQHLLEFNLQCELLMDKEQDTPVYLATFAPDGKTILDSWQTTVKEWLPFPFYARAFGQEFLDKLKKYYIEHNRR
jgi:cytidine deaminase